MKRRGTFRLFALRFHLSYFTLVFRHDRGAGPLTNTFSP
jgi:hypothetical protein